MKESTRREKQSEDNILFLVINESVVVVVVMTYSVWLCINGRDCGFVFDTLAVI